MKNKIKKAFDSFVNGTIITGGIGLLAAGLALVVHAISVIVESNAIAMIIIVVLCFVFGCGSEIYKSK